jgi:LmbE family N-acetylglucosaminyl deacetylase
MGSFDARKRIVVVAPHSDDAELGLGAYIHREHKSLDARVDVFVLADTTRSRRLEAERAAQQLGINSYLFLEAGEDSRLNTVPAGDLVQRIEGMIFDSGKIDELFIPLESFHEDHQVTHRAAIAALRPHKNRQFPQNIFCYEYPAQCWGPPAPSWGRVYAPVTEGDIAAKLAALKCYDSQWVSDDQSLFGRKGVVALASMRGAECLHEYAELFYTVRGVI